ncbi:MAG: ArnT family glycosyltransferase [Myxococcota bacterium]
MVREHGPHPPGDRRWRVLPAAAALLFAALAMDAARLETPTIDEFAHVAAAHALLVHGDTRLYAKSPPLGRALLALPSLADPAVRTPPVREPPFGWGPWQYGHRFMLANAPHYLTLFARSRAVVVLLALLCAGGVFVWSRELFGERAAAGATALFLLSPTLLAHGHLATLDVASTLAILASALALRWACARGGPTRLALAGAVLGLALLVKFTALLLLPAYALLLAVRREAGWRRGLGELLLVVAVAVGVVNAGMGFRGSFTALGEFPMASSFGSGLQAWLPASLPVPLPYDWVRGFDAQKLDVENAEFPSYALGRWSDDGFWYYEALALLAKTPLPVLAVFAVVPLALRRSAVSRREIAFAALPALSLGVMLLAFNALDVGIRYLLPLFPFVFVLCAAVFAEGSARWMRGLGLAAVAWQATVALVVHPQHLAYFNLAAGGPGGGHRVLLDSNHDWGQDLYRLPAALAELGLGESDPPVGLLYFGHVAPSLYGLDFRLPPNEPQAGVFAASVTYLKGFSYPAPGPDGQPVRVPPDALAWLADHEPVRKLGSIWLYDLREGGGK